MIYITGVFIWLKISFYNKIIVIIAGFFENYGYNDSLLERHVVLAL